MTEATEVTDVSDVTGMEVTQVLDTPAVPDRRCFLTTDFDEPVICVPPLTVTSGQEPALQVADRFFRGRAIVGRGVGSPTALGVKVDTGGSAVRVRFHLRWDAHTFDFWDRVTDEDVPRESADAPRLVLVRAQHRLRQAVLLTRPRGRGRSCGAVVIDLEPGEVSADGLLLLELWGATECPGSLPPGAATAFAPNATAGLAVTDLQVCEPRPRPALEVGDNGSTSELEAVVSLGGLSRRELERPGPRRLRSRLIVVNPNPRAVRLRLKETAASATAHQSRLRRLGALAGTRLPRIPSGSAGSAEQGGLDVLSCDSGAATHGDRTHPAAFRLGSGEAAAVLAERRNQGWDLVVPAAEEPTVVVLPEIRSTIRQYKVVSCVPEPSAER